MSAGDVTVERGAEAARPPLPQPRNGDAIAGSVRGDRVYDALTSVSAAIVPLLLGLIAVEIVIGALPAFRAMGPSFLTSSEWDPVRDRFGAAPMIFGTLVSSILALVMATPLAIGAAIFLSEFAPARIRQPVTFLIDLLAAVPSVVYGLWGMVVLIPWLQRTLLPLLTTTLGLGRFALFSGPAYGYSMLAAGLILAIMILPYISAVAREVLMAVPRSQREAALALGATRWEMIRDGVLPSARSGLVGGIMLGLGRALGETMAVTMLIGNRHEIATSLLAPGATLASVIANEFAEATGEIHVSALMAIAATLLGLTLVVNAVARWLVSGATMNESGR